MVFSMLKVITNRKEFPTYLQPYKIVKGLCIGGCISAIHNSFELAKEVDAHAHTYGNFIGVICVEKDSTLRDVRIMKHELAHLLAIDEEDVNHDEGWTKKLVKAGMTENQAISEAINMKLVDLSWEHKTRIGRSFKFSYPLYKPRQNKAIQDWLRKEWTYGRYEVSFKSDKQAKSNTITLKRIA